MKETIRLRPDMLREDREFTYCSLHKDYGNEAKIIRWLSQSFPVPERDPGPEAGEAAETLPRRGGRFTENTGRSEGNYRCHP